IRGALARRADGLYDELDEQGQETTKQLFLRLVTLGEGTEDTRRRTLLAELEGALTSIGTETRSRSLDEVITAYTQYRLLTLDRDPLTRGPTVEIAHEALIREWKRLRNWLNDNRDEIKMQRRLAAMVDEWRVAHRDLSYLARGSRLEQFERWAAETSLAL